MVTIIAEEKMMEYPVIHFPKGLRPAAQRRRWAALSRAMDHVPLLAEYLPEQHPALAVKTGELRLLDRVKIGGAGIDPDPGQQH